MAEHFASTILYTPLIPYLDKIDKMRQNSHLYYFQPILTDFTHNHIPYLNEKAFNEKVIYDHDGVGRANETATMETVI